MRIVKREGSAMREHEIVSVRINSVAIETKGTLTLLPPEPVVTVRAVVYYACGDSEEGTVLLEDLRRAVTADAFAAVLQMVANDENTTVTVYLRITKAQHENQKGV